MGTERSLEKIVGGLVRQLSSDAPTLQGAAKPQERQPSRPPAPVVARPARETQPQVFVDLEKRIAVRYCQGLVGLANQYNELHAQLAGQGLPVPPDQELDGLARQLVETYQSYANYVERAGGTVNATIGTIILRIARQHKILLTSQTPATHPAGLTPDRPAAAQADAQPVDQSPTPPASRRPIIVFGAETDSAAPMVTAATDNQQARADSARREAAAVAPPAAAEIIRGPAISDIVGSHSNRNDKGRENHDFAERALLVDEQGKPKALRLIVVDGSAGSSNDDSQILNQCDAFIDGAGLDNLNRDLLSAAQAGREAAIKNKAERANPAYGTVLLAEINEQGLRLVWQGDVAAVARARTQGGLHSFNHPKLVAPPRGSEQYQPFPSHKAGGGVDTSFQMLTRSQNHAVEAWANGGRGNFGLIDAASAANVVTGDFMQPDWQSISYPWRELRGISHLLLTTDGARPHAMVDSTKSRIRSGFQPKFDQEDYYQAVEATMKQLADGRLDGGPKGAAQVITKAARDILGDKDDITVQIVDLDGLRRRFGFSQP